jgi:hypothetical protein
MGNRTNQRFTETKMVIYMDQYRVTKAAPAAWLKSGTYAHEFMPAASSTAVIPLMRETMTAVPSPELPYDLSTVDVDELLGQAYALSTLI